MTRRFLVGGLAAVAILLLATSATMAGGWATIAPDEGAPPPTEDEATELGFTVLQHGQTPAGWEQPTVVFEEISSGQSFAIAAKASGAEGHFVAPVTLTTAGFWTWHVELRDLFVETPPSLLGVLTVDGVAPEFDAALVTSLIGRSTTDLRTEFGADYGARIESMSSEISGLSSKLARVSQERDELAEQVAAIQSGSSAGVPVAALLAVSVLGGAVSGFVMASLARRPQGPATADGPITTTPVVAR